MLKHQITRMYPHAYYNTYTKYMNIHIKSANTLERPKKQSMVTVAPMRVAWLDPYDCIGLFFVK